MHSAATRGLEETYSADEMMEALMRMKQEISTKITDGLRSINEGEDNLEESDELQELRDQVADLASKVESLTNQKPDKGNNNEGDLQTLRKSVKETKEHSEATRGMVYGLDDRATGQLSRASENIADLAEIVSRISTALASKNGPVRRLKVHMWDDSTHEHPREDILENEAWTEYNGKFDATSEPWFEFTDDPYESDIIVWITVMARHEKEIPPVNPIKHGDKVIVLDYADGGTLHRTRTDMLKYRTELGYFKRSYILHGENNSYDGNITKSYPGPVGKDIFPYAYSGSKAMMIPLDTPEADPNYQVIYQSTAKVYGSISKTSVEKENYEDGYYQDPRFKNFLVRYKDRRWNVLNVLRSGGTSNSVRDNIVKWTHEFSQNKAGDPREATKVVEELRKTTTDVESTGGFAAYVGEIDSMCMGYCFGKNYLRHLRDTKIVVTGNPSRWEGDFRLYEAFLSGALVFVDKMFILDFMPNPPVHGKHWVQYDPGDKEDFMTKLAYYSDPANLEEAEAIARAGYEFVLKHHMTVNRVDYILNHEKVKSSLMTRIRDPSKREILGYPPLDN